MKTIAVISLASSLMASTAIAQVQPRLPSDKPAAQPLVPGAKTLKPELTAPAPVQGASQGGVVQALLNQAASQRKRGRNDLSLQALHRALRESPNDPRVLQRLATYAIEDGDVGAGDRWLRRLRGVTGPSDPRVVALDKALKTRFASSVANSQDAAVVDPRQGKTETKPSPPIDPSGVSRAAGFEALERKDLAGAERLFSQARRPRTTHQDAPGGRGVRRRPPGPFLRPRRSAAGWRRTKGGWWRAGRP